MLFRSLGSTRTALLLAPIIILFCEKSALSNCLSQQPSLYNFTGAYSGKKIASGTLSTPSGAFKCIISDAPLVAGIRSRRESLIFNCENGAEFFTGDDGPSGSLNISVKGSAVELFPKTLKETCQKGGFSTVQCRSSTMTATCTKTSQVNVGKWYYETSRGEPVTVEMSTLYEIVFSD